jgi:hypothetical protein
MRSTIAAIASSPARARSKDDLPVFVVDVDDAEPLAEELS